MNTLKFREILENQKIILHPQVKTLIQFLANDVPIPDFFQIDLSQNSRYLYSHSSNNNVDNSYATLNPIEQLLNYVPYVYWKKYMTIDIFCNTFEKSLTIALLLKNDEFLKDFTSLLDVLRNSCIEEVVEIPISNAVNHLPFKDYSNLFREASSTALETIKDSLPLLFYKQENNNQNYDANINNILDTFISFSSFFKNCSTYFQAKPILKDENDCVSRSFFEWLIRSNFNNEENSDVDSDLSQFSLLHKHKDFVKSASYKHDKHQYFLYHNFFLISTCKSFLKHFSNLANTDYFSVHKEKMEEFFLKELMQLSSLCNNLDDLSTLLDDILEIDSLADTQITQKFLLLNKSTTKKINNFFQTTFNNLTEQSKKFNENSGFTLSNKNYSSNIYINNLKINKVIDTIEILSEKHNLNLDTGYRFFLNKKSPILNKAEFQRSNSTDIFISNNSLIQFLLFCYSNDNACIVNKSTKNYLNSISKKSFNNKFNISELYQYVSEDNDIKINTSYLTVKNLNKETLQNSSDYFEKFILSGVIANTEKKSKKLKF